MSGVTPKAWAAKGAPSRPKPVMTSSKTSRMPCAVADLAQPLEIALGRHQHAGRAGDRLDEDGGDRRAAIGLAEALRGRRRAPARARGWPRVKACASSQVWRSMTTFGMTHREGLAVAHHAGERDAADVDAVVGALAADEAQALRLAAGAVIGHRHLQRGVDRLGAGVGEEDVVERLGQERRHPVGELEAAGVAELERRRVVVLEHLRVHRVGDLAAGRGRPATLKRPDEPSISRSPFWFQRDMPSLFVTSRGAALKSRFADERHPVRLERRVRQPCRLLRDVHLDPPSVIAAS